MHTFFKNSFKAVLLTASIGVLNTSCNKTFDKPPVYAPPTVQANTTIRQLKAKYTIARDKAVMIKDDLTIAGVIVADDQSGNFYKQLVIQDGTSGILINMGGNNLYTTYPIGRKLYIKCQGLYLGNYSGVLQLGAGEAVSSSGFPNSLDISPAEFNQYVIKGETNVAITPVEVSTSSLTIDLLDTLQYTLIKLNNFEFAAGDTAKNYAISSTQTSENFTISNCSGNTLTLRNSGFATFADVNVPNGNGSVTGIYTLFGTKRQIFIRDTADVKFYGTRCTSGGGGGGGGTVVNLLSENFTSLTATGNPPVAIAGWNNLSEAGSRKFDVRSFSGNNYVQLSAFGSNAASLITWLVTKPVNLGSFANKTLTFDTKAGFANGAALKVLVSSNYTGTGNPWDAAVTWTDITSSATLSPGTASGYPPSFTPSGNVSLNAFSGTIYIAFKYEGADPSGAGSDKTTTWQIDNINVAGN